MTYDGINQYAYDAEGRVCAVYSGVAEDFTGYIYDGLGRRIAKGTIDPMKVTLPLTAAACDITKNGFVTTTVFVPGSNGEQLDEGDAGTTLHNSNIYANGQLLATVTSDNNLHFALNDWLGTKRVVTSASGTVEENCLSLPFGDELDCNGSDPSEQHFTGKERDSESGLDYFGARYYGSSMGRFLSPDHNDAGDGPDPIPYADFENPQSLDLYSYVLNNPLKSTDPDGHTHQECSQQTTSANANGDTVVNANCHDVPDWWNFQTNFMNWRQNMANSWNQRIAAHRPPPQQQNYLSVEDIMNMAISLPGVGTQLIRRDRLKHILEGDKTGGGHRPGTGISGKSEFPAGWSDDKIADAIADVATNPSAKEVVQGADTVRTGTVDGVGIKVVIRNGDIWSAYPTNVP